MSARDAATVVLGLAALGVVVVVARPRAGRSPRSWSVQVAVGLVCGVVGALVAVAPSVDLVPDRRERSAVLVLAVISGVVAVVAADRVISRRRQPVRRRRRPGASRAVTSRVDKGP